MIAIHNFMRHNPCRDNLATKFEPSPLLMYVRASIIIYILYIIYIYIIKNFKILDVEYIQYIPDITVYNTVYVTIYELLHEQ